MMMMRQVTQIEIPPRGSIALVPGGLHIMVKQVATGLKVGDTVPIELTFGSGAKASFLLPVVGNPRTQTPEDKTRELKDHH